MKTHVVSVFDKNYLVRAVGLYESASAALPDAVFWFLCLDAESNSTLKKMSLKNMNIESVEEMNDRELNAVRASRTAGEFAYTAKSAWLASIEKAGKFTDGDVVIFADADIVFYPAMAKYLGSMPRFSIGICPHDFPAKEAHRAETHGHYNAGMVIYQIDSESRRCIAEWRRDTIAWCYARCEDGKFADQKYLDSWRSRYSGVKELKDPGMNLGPWNDRKHLPTQENGMFKIDGAPLYSYHFHGLKIFFDGARVKPILIVTAPRYDAIYRDCADKLTRALAHIRRVEPNWSHGFLSKPSTILSLKRWLVRQIKYR